MPGSQAVLSLYRQLLRQGRQLKFTDKKYYFSRIRREFEKNSGLSNVADIEVQVQKAKVFLQNNRLV